MIFLLKPSLLKQYFTLLRIKRIQIKDERYEVSLLKTTINPAGGLERPRPHWATVGRRKSDGGTEREKEGQTESE